MYNLDNLNVKHGNTRKLGIGKQNYKLQEYIEFISHTSMITDDIMLVWQI